MNASETRQKAIDNLKRNTKLYNSSDKYDNDVKEIIDVYAQ
jgi:hypothetical protein